ncbi:MAG: hypothetical protein U0984_10605 [Prosthecobacter sp.]|nr:hypothetical protein [Prosthecobacter sp.]
MPPWIPATTRNPAQTLKTLAGDPELLAWAPDHRAALMARADVSQPDQRQQIEAYLATLADRPQELETFTQIFPNRNGSLGNALITTPAPSPAFQQLRAQDQATLAAVSAWISSGRYAAIEPNLQQIATRLTGFVNQLSTSQDGN